ncbi:MAG: hypothetical protein AMXMBFR33_42770 [Candidatus Xenobia bacterium]
MQDGLKAMFAEERKHIVALAQVADDQFRSPGHGFSMACAEIVKDCNAMTRFEKLGCYIAADIPGSAGHEDVHGRSLFGPGGEIPRCQAQAPVHGPLQWR